MHSTLLFWGARPIFKNDPGSAVSASFYSDVRGKEGSNIWNEPNVPNSAPPSLALPSPALKRGTFYFAKKRNFLFCVDSQNMRMMRMEEENRKLKHVVAELTLR